MNHYLINEIFYSLQGEGYNTGTPSVFVRFSGCNLKCHFCDTQHQNGTKMPLQDIVNETNKHINATWIILTGGEPSLFIDEMFVETLKTQTNKKIAVETNGTRLLPTNIDWVTLSPKTTFTGGDIEPCILRNCDELKVVFCGQDLTQYDDYQTNNRFLQPCFSENKEQFQLNMKSCVETVMQNPQWRLSLQIHRFLGIR